MSWQFFLTSLVVVLIPGSGAIFTLTAGLTRGTRASILAAFASTLSIIPHVIAALCGAAAILHTSAIAFQSLKYLGVAYLLYMAWGTLRDERAFQFEDEASAQTVRQVITSGILINLLNPKVTIFFFAFLPQFVHPGETNATARMLELSGIFMLITFVVFVIYGATAAALRRKILERPTVMRWLRRSFAGSFALLGIRLAVSDH